MELKKLIIGAVLIAVIVIVISQFSSALETSWSKYDSNKLSLGKKGKDKVDSRTSGEKYYYNYTAKENPSNWRNKKVYNTKEYPVPKNETYVDNYYYKPRYNKDSQSYNWRF